MTDGLAVPRVPVLTASEARALDVATIAATGDSYALMQRAATESAAWLTALPDRSAAVYVGTGNNGGDGWLIAALLREQGWRVAVHSCGPPTTADARRAHRDACRDGDFPMPAGDERILIDAVLGTGGGGPLRGAARVAIEALRVGAATGHRVVAVDLPSGLDASVGEDAGAVAAAHTLTFGGVKRGTLLRRELVGELVVLDIGLLAPESSTPRLTDAACVASWVPTMPPATHKGDRKRLAIVGGDPGMAGAAVLSARGAHASGIGMVRAHVALESRPVLQTLVPFATVAAWTAETDDWSAVVDAWPHALVIGPGLDAGDGPLSDASHRLRRRLRTLLQQPTPPLVLDAGILSAFAGRADELADLLDGREAIITPHIGEFRRLIARAVADDAQVLVDPFADATVLAQQLGATVLLKGVPTIIATPDGRRYLSATGTPALAMGGSGDLLSGIVGTLLAQGLDPLEAGAAGAFVHGTAAERATRAHGGWRGVTMDALVQHVGDVWPAIADMRGALHGVMLTLPPVAAR